MQRMVVIGWGLSFGPVLDWLVVSNRIARLRNLSVGGVHGHISSGCLQADIDSVNRLSWIAMTDVTEGSDTGVNRCFDPLAATPCDSRRNCEPKKAPSSEPQEDRKRVVEGKSVDL